MKKYILVILPLAILISCNKIEETINEQIDKTTTTVKEKAQNAVKETLSNSINSVTNAEDAQFQEVFPNGEPTMISDFKGKKFTFPNGSPAFLFRYKADRDLLIPYLEQQETSDEMKSDKVAKKMDGKTFLDKLSFIEKFLPPNMIDMTFLEDLKNDKSIEYYKLKRFPNNSTIIYSPKTQQIYQFVEVSK